MKSRQDYDSALAAEYALGTLRGAARRRFSRRLPQEPALAAEVSRWQNALAELDRNLTPVQPPEAVWQRIVRSLPADPAARRRVSWPWLGWALAASFAGALVWVQISSSPAPAPQAVAVLSGGQQAGSWVVSLSADRRQLTVQALGTAAIPPQHSLQLWLIPPGEKPQSLGLLAADIRQQQTLAAPELVGQPLLAISLEPQGGSPTGLPTGPVLFSGPVTRL